MNFMKIAVITDHIPSQWAHSINTMKIAKGFSKLGHKVEVLVVRRYLEEKNRFKIRNVHNFYDLDKRIRFKYFRDYSPYYFREIRYFGPFMALVTNIITKFYSKLRVYLDPEKRISEYCKRNKFDFAFCRRTYNAVYYNIVNKIPTVLDKHNYRDSKLQLILKFNKSKYFRGIMTINELLKKKLINKGFSSNEIRNMENAVDIDKFNQIKDDKINLRKKLNIPLNKKIILYSGGLYGDRDIDIIINASKFLESEKFCFLFIGGTKKDIRRWKNYKRRHKIESDVKFLGFKPKILIPYYLKAVDILLATYSEDCSTLDIMSPVKIIEYMAAKVPIIITKIGRTIELYNNDVCLYIRPNDPKDMSEKVKLLITDENLRKKLTKNAYTIAMNFSIEKRCEKILELI